MNSFNESEYSKKSSIVPSLQTSINSAQKNDSETEVHCGPCHHCGIVQAKYSCKNPKCKEMFCRVCLTSIYRFSRNALKRILKSLRWECPVCRRKCRCGKCPPPVKGFYKKEDELKSVNNTEKSDFAPCLEPESKKHKEYQKENNVNPEIGSNSHEEEKTSRKINASISQDLGSRNEELERRNEAQNVEFMTQSGFSYGQWSQAYTMNPLGFQYMRPYRPFLYPYQPMVFNPISMTYMPYLNNQALQTPQFLYSQSNSANNRLPPFPGSVNKY